MTRPGKIKLLLFIFAAISPQGLHAQYDQSIAVEGKYKPEYIDHDRIGVFPRPVRFGLDESPLQFSLGGVNAGFAPQVIPVQATGWNIRRKFADTRGYVDLGLGSWLESTLSAGYRFIDTRSSSVGVRLQHNSTSLWKPEVFPGASTKMERYDEMIGLYAGHSFDGTGRIEGAVDYHLGNFNYYGFDPTISGGKVETKAPTQTLNDVAARIEWHSEAAPERLSWNLGAGVRYFGYRSFYLPFSTEGMKSIEGGKETHVNIKGDIAWPASAKSSLGIEVAADYLHYARGRETFAGIMTDADPYWMVSLTPYYRFIRQRFIVNIGARVDLAFNAGPEDDRYKKFHIAPAVRLDYDAGPVSIFLHALGGSTLHTLASGYEADYYQAPLLGRSTPVYTPLDAKLGVNFGPYSGFHAGIDFAYRISRGQYAGGFYQCFINDDTALLQAALPQEINGHPVAYDAAPGNVYNINGFSAGVNVAYDMSRYFKAQAEARYQPQNGERGYFNGYDRPEWTVDAALESNPWSTLRLKLSYQLRALRDMPAVAVYTDTFIRQTVLQTYRLPNLSMLNFGASYGITDKINVWLQANNLLNLHTDYMAGLPEPGVRIIAGVGIRF